MNIYSINPAESFQSSKAKPEQTLGDKQQAFTNNLKSAIEHINKTQKASDEKTTALANGEVDDLHDVMITAQKASITLQTGVQVQKKAIDAYNEVMRMQV